MTIPAGFAQVNFRFGGIAAPTGAEFTLGLDVTGSGDTPEDVADVLRLLIESDLMPALNGDLSFLGVLVKFGPDATGPSAFVASSDTGGSAGNGATPQVAYLIQKLTALGGRAGRGRMFLPGVVEGNVNDAGELEAGVASGFDTIWDGIGTAIALNSWTPVLLHQPGSPLVMPTPITGFRTDPRAATQRQRLRR